jgi:hypothetical protein
MGVNIFLLDRRLAELSIGTSIHKIGVLRRFWKSTEIDEARATKIADAKAELGSNKAPAAVLISDISDLPLASSPNEEARSHLVLGWDADRYSVTDLGWDFLPVLGYAVRLPGSSVYKLHESRKELLHPMTRDTAIANRILSRDGKLLRRGQPLIHSCSAVRPYVERYAQAECVLDDGREVKIVTVLQNNALPTQQWYEGKRPADVEHFP